MLVLGRKAGESIYIGEEIVIKILDIQQRSLQIGITAPASVSIVRDNARKKRRDLPGQVPPTLLARNLPKNKL
jgi:carbon storage regulator